MHWEKTALLLPCFDNLPLLMRRRNVNLVSLVEAELFILYSNKDALSNYFLENSLSAEKWLSHYNADIIEFRVIQEGVNKIRILTVWKSGTPTNKAMQCTLF